MVKDGRKYGVLTLLTGLLISPCFFTAEAVSTIQPQHLYSLTRDKPLIQAVLALWRSGETDCVNTLLTRPVRLVMKPLATLDPALKQYDAVSWISPEGQQYVFVNNLHKLAPPAALAALIGHEMLHDDEQNSLQEEVFSWTMEAKLWQRLKTFYPQVAQQLDHPLVKRLNTMEQQWQANTLEQYVRQNPAYKALPETSPGFSDPDLKPAEPASRLGTSGKAHRLP
jgi:hypothetical protein